MLTTGLGQNCCAYHRVRAELLCLPQGYGRIVVLTTGLWTELLCLPQGYGRIVVLTTGLGQNCCAYHRVRAELLCLPQG